MDKKVNLSASDQSFPGTSRGLETLAEGKNPYLIVHSPIYARIFSQSPDDSVGMNSSCASANSTIEAPETIYRMSQANFDSLGKSQKTAAQNHSWSDEFL